MDYIKYNFKIQPRDPWVDILMSDLSDLPFDTFEETELGFEAYIPQKFNSKEVFELIESYKEKPELSIEFEVQEIAAQNWNAEWESSFTPVSVGNFCNIRADFHPITNEFKHEIVITPKMSFGTGHHPTTYLMVQEMSQLKFDGKKVLDMGSGTGVLAILAKKLGATDVLGIDIEEWAVENAIENAENNHIEAVFKLGGKEQITDKGFDVVLANINRNILLDQISKYSEVMNPKGHLLLSGFMKEDVDMLIESAKNLGFEIIKEEKKEQWICLVFQKS